MLICICAKITASLLGVLIASTLLSFPIAQALAVGVFPIWVEVVASFFTRVEPAREKNRRLLQADAAADIFCFLLAPLGWYLSSRQQQDPFIYAASLVFLTCGLYRICRFLKKGLSKDGYFSGLPVTYTGYLWPILVLLPENAWGKSLVAISLAIVSWAMVSSHISIKASR